MNGGGPSPRASSRHHSVLGSGGYGSASTGGPYSLLSPGSEGSSIESMGGHLAPNLDTGAGMSAETVSVSTLPDNSHVMMPTSAMYSQVPVLATSSSANYPHEAVQYVTNLGSQNYTSEPSYNPYIASSSAEGPISYVVSQASEATALNLSNAVPLFAPVNAANTKLSTVSVNTPSAPPPTIAISYIQPDGNTATYEAIPVVNTDGSALTSTAAVVVEQIPTLPPPMVPSSSTTNSQVSVPTAELPGQVLVTGNEQGSAARQESPADPNPQPPVLGPELPPPVPASTA